MIKSKKTKTQQLKLCTKNCRTIKNMADQEDNNFSDSSLELFDTINPKSKKKNNSHEKLNLNFMIDQIDLTNESDTELANIRSKEIETKSSSTIISVSSSVCNISSNSNESFKSFTSCSNPEFSDTNSASVHVNSLDKFSELQNNYTTPKEERIQTSCLSESAKLLDCIYGKQWRSIEGVIKNSKKNLNDELFGNFNESDEKISNNNYSEIENISFCEYPTKTSKYLKKKDIQNEVNDTSVILENISLSNNSYNLLNNQLNIDSSAVIDHEVKFKTSSQQNTNECNNIKLNCLKELGTFKIIKKGKSDIKKDDLNHKSKIPVKSNSEAKLSFLSSLSYFTGSVKCDPKAEKYKLKFKKNKDDLVLVLFKLFNEEVFDNKLPVDMNFKWNARLRSTAGACFNRRSVKINQNLDCERVSRIELSSKIIDTAERLRDTLIHELCHAACWIFNGIAEGHGPSWKSWANKAMNKFPELPIIKRCHSYDVQTKFTYKCIKCGYSFGRHSKSLNLERKRCGYCCGEFELIVNKINNNPMASNKLPVVYSDPLKELYNLNDVRQKSKAPRKPTKFALFVKENYSRVKREYPLSKHGEIMKLLGSQFATTKILTPDEVFDKILDS